MRVTLTICPRRLGPWLLHAKGALGVLPEQPPRPYRHKANPQATTQKPYQKLQPKSLTKSYNPKAPRLLHASRPKFTTPLHSSSEAGASAGPATQKG